MSLTIVLDVCLPERDDCLEFGLCMLQSPATTTQSPQLSDRNKTKGGDKRPATTLILALVSIPFAFVSASWQDQLPRMMTVKS